MIGREAYGNPYIMTEIERDVLGTQGLRSREEVIAALIPYIERCMAQGVPVKDITRHILGLYQGMRGARRWRQILSQEAHKPAANSNIVRQALAEVAEAS